MSRIAQSLVNEGVPERIAEAVDYGFDATRDSVASYLARISEQIWDCASGFGVHNDRDLPASMRASEPGAA